MILPAFQVSSFVAASVLIAVLTAYVAMETSSRIPEHTGSRRTLWLFISAACLGGGIWSMHFVAMLGYVLPIPVGYDITLTIASFFLPIFMAAWGFHLAFQTEALHLSRAVALGFIYGLAIAGMHYTGMAAMRMDATIDWNIFYIILSIFIAIVAATASIGASFMRMSFLPTILGSLIMGGAISGMHYTAMCAVTVIGDTQRIETDDYAFSVDRESLGLWVTAVTFIILTVGLLTAAYDRRTVK